MQINIFNELRMKKIRNSVYLIIFGICLCTLYSCKKETEIIDPNALGAAYYPLTIDKFWIYKVDSINYSKTIGVVVDSSSSYIMELVRDSFLNKENEQVYEIDIFHQRDTGGVWELIDNSFITRNKSNLRKTEFGLDFIRLVFPVQKNKSWDGNILIAKNNSVFINGEPFEPFRYWNGNTYYYKNILKNVLVGEKQYAKVAEVEEINYDNDLYNYIYATAKYAENAGMVYREFWLLKTSIDNPSVGWKQKAERGFILRQTLIQHN